jgi:hypothetical protein
MELYEADQCQHVACLCIPSEKYRQGVDSTNIFAGCPRNPFIWERRQESEEKPRRNSEGRFFVWPFIPFHGMLIRPDLYAG